MILVILVFQVLTSSSVCICAVLSPTLISSAFTTMFYHLYSLKVVLKAEVFLTLNAFSALR